MDLGKIGKGMEGIFMMLAINRDLDIIETRRTRANASNARLNGHCVGGGGWSPTFTHVTRSESIYNNVFDLLSSGNSSSHN